MTLRSFDKCLCIALLLFALIHCYFTLAYTHKDGRAVNGALFLGFGVAMVLTAMMNGVRIARAGDAMLRKVSLVGNVLMLVAMLAMLHAIGSGIAKAPQAVVGAVLVGLELVFSAVPRK